MYTRCSFSRISAPKIYPKIDEKNDRKMEHFFGPLLEGLGSHSVTMLGSKSHLKIDQKINATLDRFLDDFRLILGSMWVPFALRDGTGTPPRRPKTLSRRSQDAPKTPKDAKKAPQEAPRGPNTPPSSILDDLSSNFHRFFIDFFIIFSWIFHCFFIDVLICWDYCGTILVVLASQ